MSPLWLYRISTHFGTPFVELVLRCRLSRGKEDVARLAERRGIASRPRPAGKLVWLHASSVGESQSSLALISALIEDRSDCYVLQTTGTVTSARLMQERLPSRSFHQFAPIDCLPWVRRFLEYWKPDIALWMESELWPNLLFETKHRQIPCVLVNARMSDRTYARWRKFPETAKSLLKTFSLCLAQTEEHALFLGELGAKPIKFCGNLKFSASPLPVDEEELRRLRKQLGVRPIWMAASTHPGEEDVAADIHLKLATELRNLLTIIVPRHPARGNQIVKDLRARGLTVAQRSLGEAIGGEIYVADTLGELGLFYRLSETAFIGGSMASYGGHNPLEAARLKCSVVLGPDMGNFSNVAKELVDAKGAVQVFTREAIADAVGQLLKNDKQRQLMSNVAFKFSTKNAGAVKRIHKEINGLMNGW